LKEIYFEIRINIRNSLLQFRKGSWIYRSKAALAYLRLKTQPTNKQNKASELQTWVWFRTGKKTF